MWWFYIFMFSVASFPSIIDSCGSKAPASIDGLTGNQLPPPDSGFYEQFHKCGVINECKGSGMGCLNKKRKKRSNLKAHSNNSRGDDYIKGGTDQPDYRYPWVGRLVYYRDKTWFETLLNLSVEYGGCTVVLITSRHVLTAKHCFRRAYKIDYDEIVSVYKRDLRVVFGPVGAVDPHYSVDEIYSPPQVFTSAHDLVVAKIYEVKFSATIRPICLPIFGVPVVPATPTIVDFVGHGHSGYYTSLGSKKWVSKSYLQELKDLKLTHTLTIDPEPWGLLGEVYKSRKMNGVLRTSFLEIVFPAGPKRICKGDSGGPLMWQNPKTKKYVLLGIMAGFSGKENCMRDQDSKEHRTIFMKVSEFLPKIINYIKGSNETVCMHPDCKSKNSNGIVKRTWLANIHDTTSEVYQTLNSPCFYGLGVGVTKQEPIHSLHVCPVGLSGDRTLDIKFGPGRNPEGWRNCASCPDPDWDASHLIDEITAGSMSQDPYFGVETPQLKPEDFVDRKNHLPYMDVCETNVNHEHDLLKCPKHDVPGAPTHECLLPENICDGRNDCYDGWDESPHLCNGKCDFFYQYQYSNLSYNILATKKHESYQSSAKKCQKECVQDLFCTHFNWKGDNLAFSDKICETIEGPYSNMFEPSTDDTARVVRGPVQCGDRNDPGSYFSCVPTIGAPYRSGFFLIQTKTGHFLEAMSITNPKDDRAWIKPSEFVAVTRRALWVEKPVGIKSFNGAEWILVFQGKTSMGESWFLIRSGYQNGHLPNKYLTAERGNQISIKKKKARYGNGRSENQRWYIEQAKQETGFLEVKIYSKLGNVQVYLTSPIPLENDDGNNYHHNPAAGDKQYPLKIQNAASAAEYNTQVFRMFECDHALESGKVIRGIKRKTFKNYNIKKMLAKMTANMSDRKKREAEGTSLYNLMHYFNSSCTPMIRTFSILERTYAL